MDLDEQASRIAGLLNEALAIADASDDHLLAALISQALEKAAPSVPGPDGR